jgi:ABC-type Mn2+/Zn2+ transport system ATPase subunit
VGVLLEISRASFGYGDRAVVAGVDLAVSTGGFVGIVGPNGGGKTTLIRGILGLLAPLTGRVELRTHAIGYVPQRESLDAIYPLRVEEVVVIGAYGRLRGIRRVAREDRELARACLERVRLADLRREPFASLSGGQRQRALIARGLMARPELLLLDEPTSGVDRAAQARILELLVDLNRREGMAILLASHQLAMVRETVREVLWVSDGRAVHGDAATLLAPENLDRLYAAGDAAPGGREP